jgi:hypothetical protein
MNGERIQALAFRGLAIAAKKVGTDFKLFRPASMIDPVATGTELLTTKVSATTGYDYAKYNLPKKPDLTLIVDGALIQAGDYLVGESIYYIPRIQPLLPIPAIQCNRTVSLEHSGYSTGPSGELKTGGVVYATNLPVFMIAKKDKSSTAHLIPAASDSQSSMSEWVVFINSRTLGEVNKHDVLIDEMGNRYEIVQVSPTDRGAECLAREEKA